MKLNICIGGKAGQGINKISAILSSILTKYGYYTFNYRDYQSLIRGGHNFNVLSISDEPVNSQDSKINILVCFDARTLSTHQKNLTKKSIIINSDDFRYEGKNLNVALAGSLVKILGIPLECLLDEIKIEFSESKKSIASAEKGYNSKKEEFFLRKLNNKIEICSGNKAIALGARKANLDIYIAYPMSPSTNALHEIAKKQLEENRLVFQAENEISVISMALGASFAGAKTLIGTSGGGFDLMGESLSMQGMSEIPLCIYLASRQGPSTGVPTYNSQADLDIALRSGHGEFPRIVVAPGTPNEIIEKVQECLFLSEKFKSLSIVLSDKHLAESEYSSSEKPKDIPQYKIERKIPGSSIIKASSYEKDEFGNSTELASLTEKNTDKRFERYEEAKDYILKNCEMIKIHGKKDSKNLIIGWGSTSNAIKDAIKGLDVKFLQVLYMKPMSDEIRKEIQKAKHIIVIECNITGQLGRLIREKTGIKIDSRILKYDGRPFYTDELKENIEEWVSK